MLRVFGPSLRPNASNLTRQKSLFSPIVFHVVLIGRNTWLLVPRKGMLTLLSCRFTTSQPYLLHVATVIEQAQHYDFIDGVIASSKRLARRVGYRYIFLWHKKREKYGNLKAFFINTEVATIFLLADWLKKLASITSTLTFLNVS